MAERQVARRLKAQRRVNYETRWKQERKTLQGSRMHEAAVLRRRAVRARHEDWEMGPLAPRRDVPILPGDANVLESQGGGPLSWGSISSNRASLGQYYTEAEREASAAWAGGMKRLCIRPGDRVVVMEGPCKGQIGEINMILEHKAAVEIQGVGVVSCGRIAVDAALAGSSLTAVMCVRVRRTRPLLNTCKRRSTPKWYPWRAASP